MSYLTILYSAIAGTALTICVVHLVVWFGYSRRRAYLFSATMALAASAQAMVELALTQTGSTEAAGELLRWGNFTVAATLLCMVWFVHLHLSAGRSWLLWSIVGLWSVALVINFNTPTSLTFLEIRPMLELETFWGEAYFQPQGPTNPLKFLADLASLLIMIFVVDASLAAWRKGARQTAVVIGGAVTFFIVVAGIHTPLVDAGIVKTPTIISTAFVAILAAISYETGRDVSRAHRLSAELRAEQERVRSVFETVQLVVLDIDASGHLRYANPSFLALGGWDPDKIIGQPATHFIPSRIVDQLLNDLHSITGSQPPQESIFTLTTDSGEGHQLAMTAVRVGDADGRFAGILCVASDITQELETTQKLARTRLKLDRVMRSNLLGEFASSLAHELNQPLAAILANAQVTRRYLQQAPPKLDQALTVVDEIIQDDQRAAELIAQLRALVHQDVAVREPLDLTLVSAETEALLKRELNHHQVRLAIASPAHPVVVEVSRVEIQQVILNLLLNAMQAVENLPVPRRTIAVQLTTKAGTAQFAVMDAGPGLPTEKLETVFEAFNTGNNGNIGLGLTICRRIIEAHGGLIAVANRSEGGAAFTFTLPLVAAEENKT
ncbi:MAG: PAS domain-containing sensor histidine kinase [Candidatus Krumholzibacteria bacterium]|nr:PAS domain-containing sensor histidine kinase [Candidatus Krumholzibacteria bacterium]